MADEEDVGATTTLSVFFCASDGDLTRPRTWVETFFMITSAVNLSQAQTRLPVEPCCQYKIGFNGCGTDFGPLGFLFGRGLETQCDYVVDRVLELASLDLTLVVNCIGCSRGAVAALLLTKRLEAIRHRFTEEIQVNLCLLDPVPGNFIFSAKIDKPFGITLANQVLDLTSCTVLRRVVALYPFQPLPAWMAHAPVLPDYPPQALVDEDAILGVHQSAFSAETDLASKLTFGRVARFLVDAGTVLDERSLSLNTLWFGLDDDAALDQMDHVVHAGLPQRTRIAHTSSWLATGCIRTNAEPANYLNFSHQHLAAQLQEHTADSSDDLSPLLRRQQHTHVLQIRRSHSFSFLCFCILALTLLLLLALLFIVSFFVFNQPVLSR